ncbi:tyrosine-type recombinase/integrase [Burkholderia pyrrocinia]|uniref:tyrosine-type recombinase/integrase n=1 Tax=Burkholderia pyrrocinia TaxID=60550 RepID=UPI00215AB97A|nr:tyrosine-type recombinase/integrase [Burkholderia pyrrocinia]UVE67739.1 tyrosine-type recombinase/integrase [Burkholderia pyrrocinia]
MRLISSTSDFLISGRPYPGFPILLWDNMEGCRPVNEFFRFYLLRGAIGSKKSWINTARALYDYFSFLQTHDLRWDDVSRGEQKTLVAAYRDYCLEEYDLARATVRNRLVYICKFYEFAMHQQWIPTLPFSYDIRRMSVGGRFLAHVNASGGVVATPDVMPRTHKWLPKFLSPAQVKQLLHSAENPHHRMIIRLALGTGLRKEELATFPLAYVFDPDRPYRHERNVRVSLDPRDGHGMRTKGSKARAIYVSRQLMQDLHHYAVHQRGLRSALSSHERPPLFLNQSGEPYSSDGKSLDRIVRLIGQKIGLHVWTHMLRHTYATHTLVALQRERNRNRIEPVVFLQRQLGHASIQTTMVYLHLINELADDAVLAYDDELNNLAAEE